MICGVPVIRRHAGCFLGNIAAAGFLVSCLNSLACAKHLSAADENEILLSVRKGRFMSGRPQMRLLRHDFGILGMAMMV